jgi:hypothetical protein
LITNVPLLAATVRPVGMNTVPDWSAMSTALPRKSTVPNASRTGGRSPVISKRVSSMRKRPFTSSPDSATPLPRRPASTFSRTWLSVIVPPNTLAITQARAPGAVSVGHNCLAWATGIDGTSMANTIDGALSAKNRIEARANNSPRPVRTPISDAVSRPVLGR